MDTDTPPPDTSTRRELMDRLQHVADAATHALRSLHAGDDAADLVPVTRYLRSEAQQAATMAAYARALRPTVQERQA